MPWKKLLAWATGQIDEALRQKLEFVLEENRVYRPLPDRHSPHWRQIFFERMVQGTLAEKNQWIETLLFDRPHPTFGKSVEVGRLGRKLERFNAHGLKEGIECLGEFGIAIMEEKAGVGHGAILDGRVVGDLL